MGAAELSTTESPASVMTAAPDPAREPLHQQQRQ
jgi:hypothetical protein